MATLIGDIGKVKRWAEGIRQLANPQRHEELNLKLSYDARELVEKNFQAQSGPAGAWARKVIPDGNAVGEQSGKLRASYVLRKLSARGFTIGPAGPARKYAGIFQRGRGPIVAGGFGGGGTGMLRFVVRGRVIFRKSVAGSPARPIVPHGRLPRSWERKFLETTRRWFHQTLTGR